MPLPLNLILFTCLRERKTDMTIVEKIRTGKTYLGIELGSTRIKACLIDDEMKPIASGAHEWKNRFENGYWTYSLDDIHNGIRDLHFDAICYIPESAISTAANGTVVVSSELYDAYTGMWLTAGSTFNNSSRGDNYYLHTVSWRGNSYLIEFTYSTDCNFQVGDWGAVLTKSYSVYLPADYDGLVFAAQAEPDTYEKSARKMQLDSISPEACVLDLDTLEPYSSLYFSICY